MPLVLAALTGATVTALGRLPQEEPAFPHREHAGLFPLCTGCHQGVPEGERDAFYPETALCGRCHDGEELEAVAWEPPEPEPTNLVFRHPDHARAAAERDEPLACSDCHTREGGTRMAVEGVLPQRCLSCHEHRADDHYADAACSTCHRPLAESRFSLARIEALPEPASHRAEDFLPRRHGEAAEASTQACSTCHTRERCTSCHVDPSGAEAIARLPEAPQEMRLPASEARYPTPSSHRDPGWIRRHGARAAEGTCSTCHVQESCATCHRESRPEAVARLASRSETSAPGAGVERSAPESHGSPFFATEHGAVASASPGSCTSCHARATCESCHASETGSGFHPPDFMSRHSSQAYGARLECSNCHNTTAFCRDCHEKIGMGSEGRLGPGFHDGVPSWLFRHGQAARQGLESCASCHAQRDCLQCHSQIGAFRVNPHGPSFDAERYAERNREICFACHLSDPLDGSSP